MSPAEQAEADAAWLTALLNERVFPDALYRRVQLIAQRIRSGEYYQPDPSKPGVVAVVGKGPSGLSFTRMTDYGRTLPPGRYALYADDMPWRNAVDEALVVNCIHPVKPEEMPKVALSRLIRHEMLTYTDADIGGQTSFTAFGFLFRVVKSPPGTMPNELCFIQDGKIVGRITNIGEQNDVDRNEGGGPGPQQV